MYVIQSLIKISHFLIISLVFFSTFTLTLSKQCNPYDENILLELKTQLGNPPAFAPTWNSTSDCCSDWGPNIQCDDNGHVITLILGLWEDISSPIPPVLGRLTSVRTLELHNRNISGPFPADVICNLTRLKELAIVSTSMYGVIPTCLGRLTGLTFLEISFNERIVGPIPDSFGQLINLVTLQLIANKLSGPLPDSLYKMKSLTMLSAVANQISGSIPASLALAPNLTEIYLGNNSLSGEIPQSFGQVRSSKGLVFLDLHDNQLSGPIPKSLGRANIGAIDLSGNRLTGDLLFLAGLNETFQLVNLSKNRLKFDFSKAQLPRGLRNLDVSHNMIYGSLPRQLGQLPLYNIGVSYNQLCGPIPTGRRLKQFDPVIFSHNKCLCGPPLPPCK